MKRKTISLSLSVLCVFAFCAPACKKGETDGEYTVWTTNAINKVLKDVEYDISTVDKHVTVSAAQNEYEGWQIILSADENCASTQYDVILSDLENENGDVYSSENVNLFNEIYIDVFPKEYYTVEGAYPDGILPFDIAKEYDENTISKNENCGVYLEFYIPKDQPSGTYTGTVEVKVGDITEKVPVTLVVWDYAISDTTTAKSHFLVDWNYWDGELNSTQEMYEKYIDALLKYRLSSGVLLYDNDHSEACVEQYTELAYKYASNPKCPSIAVPQKFVTSKVEYEYNNQTVEIGKTFDETVFEDYILSFAKKSAETGVNILEKAVCYHRVVDEPWLHGTQARAKYVAERFSIKKQELYDKILQSNLPEDKITKQELADSALKIPGLITTPIEDEYVGYDMTFCPTVDYYDSDTQREAYGDMEKWWYACCAPNYPYPTYHIDDSLLSTRLMYWMASEYDIVGNLNWGVNEYSVYGEIPEDFYEYAIHGSSQNGEGFLFYPGAKYGIDGPVETLRLQTYRDGIEEYEILQEIKDKYKTISKAIGVELDYEAIFTHLTKSLYTGTKWNTSEDNFYRQRESLSVFAQLALSNEEDCALLTGFEKKGSSYSIDLFATNNCKVYVNGELKTGTTSYESGDIYNINVDLSDYDKREILLTVDVAGVSKDITFDLGGKSSIVSIEDFRENITTFEDGLYAGVTNELVDANGIGEFTDGKLERLTIVGGEMNNKPSIDIQGGFLSEISKNDEMQIAIYSNVEMEMEIFFKYQKGAAVMKSAVSVKLKQGMNYVTVSNLQGYNWSSFGGVDKMRLLFYTTSNATVYLREIILTEK